MVAAALQRTIRISLADKHYRVGEDRPQAYSLRDRLEGGYATVQITNRNEFEWRMQSRMYADVIRFSWHGGAQRVLKQEVALDHLAEVTSPIAWHLVTCYYSAFFAANELTRASGRLATYFNAAQIERVAGAAPASEFGLEEGGYYGNSRGDGTGDEVVCVFRKSATGFHEQVWRNMGALLSDACSNPSRAPVGWEVLRAVCHANQWQRPNAVRNRWNYQAPQLYGREGQRVGRHFLECVRDIDKAFAWVKKKTLPPTSEENLATSIAFLRAVLVKAMEACNALFA